MNQTPKRFIMNSEEIELLKKLLEKYKDHIHLNMPDDTVSSTKLETIKTYGDSILLHTRGYNIKHEE
jgi:hypothetical protein